MIVCCMCQFDDWTGNDWDKPQCTLDWLMIKMGGHRAGALHCTDSRSVIPIKSLD